MSWRQLEFTPMAQEKGTGLDGSQPTTGLGQDTALVIQNLVLKAPKNGAVAKVEDIAAAASDFQARDVLECAPGRWKPFNGLGRSPGKIRPDTLKRLRKVLSGPRAC